MQYPADLNSSGKGHAIKFDMYNVDTVSLEAMGKAALKLGAAVADSAKNVTAAGLGQSGVELVAASKEALARFAAENFPGCDMKQIQDMNGSCIQIKDKESGLTMEIDWSFYTPFYGNAFRNTIGKTQTMHCRDTTMIAMAVKYILQDMTPFSDFIKERKTISEGSKGGRHTKRKRKTRKTRKTRKRNK
jgi:hypothetical protein